MEREARSLALEEAYVHEVYHQMGCQESKAPWPRVVQFLNHLEPGSIVCDVGCGSGKYLSVNPSVFKLGVDRCNRLAETARLEQNEVLVCDNLTLPFRDESFDAVLSIAVVHHFATTERRVGALRELARVLRIGGRLVISVWAMEQRHRKFESQDVLVPWHRPQALSTPSLELTPTTTSEDDSHLHHHPYTACTQTSDSDSNRSIKNNKERKKGKEKQKEVTTSPSCSSLSSPNETCYSFVRRALQKLAGNKRGNSRNRPWFLDSWTSCSSKDPPPRRYDPEGCEDIHDLPIELRRLEEDHDIPSRRQTFTCSGYSSEQQVNQKSRSLTDIFNHEQKLIVRSQSSVPSLDNVEISAPKAGTETVPTSKPRLVKQKKSVCEDDIDSEERDQATDMKDLVKALPEFKITGFGISRKGNVFKQSSMNEELMSTERLREKEKLKQNIQKQASLNEELIFNRNNKTLDSLKDSIFSTSTAKRFQILKNGLTNKIKNSTTGIEKVAGSSIKNGFVRILQGWTSSDVNIQIPQQLSNPSSSNLPEVKSAVIENKKEQASERRHSKEDGSDSSKDSSLQSDTSVDSEDSFASVIFIPKAEQVDQQSTNTSPTLHSNPASPQPTSPKIKFPPPVSPKLKNSQHSFGMSSHPASPKLKNPNQLLGSSSPSSPKIKYFPQPSTSRPYQNNFSTSPTRTTFKQNMTSNGNNAPPTSKSNEALSKHASTNPFKSPTSTTQLSLLETEISNVENCNHENCNSEIYNPENCIPENCNFENSNPENSNPENSDPENFIPENSDPEYSNPDNSNSDNSKFGNSNSENSNPEIPNIDNSYSENSNTENSNPQNSEPKKSNPVNSIPVNPSHENSKIENLNTENDNKKEEHSIPSSSKCKVLMKSSLLSSVSKIDFDSLKHKSNVEKPTILQHKEHQKSVTRTQFPLVRRSMTISGRSDSPPSRPVPRLLSLEIFNPETDDMDSDSSGVSSPDSIGSVISIKNEDEVQESKKEKDDIRRTSGVGAEIASLILKSDSQIENSSTELKNDDTTATSKFSPLLEAAAGVATCLEETVDTVIQSSPRSRRKQLQLMCDPWMALQDDVSSHNSPKNEGLQNDAEAKNKGSSQLTMNLAPSPKRNKPSLKSIGKIEMDPNFLMQEYNNNWNEECRQHLADFAEKLSEKLLAEIDRYREQKSMSQQLSPVMSGDIQCIDDSSELYLSRLNEDLEDINKITVSLQKDEEDYIAKMMEYENRLAVDKEELGRIKGEGASSEEEHVELKKEDTTKYEAIKKPDLVENRLVESGKIISIVKLEPEVHNKITEDSIPLLQEDNDCFFSSTIDFQLHDTEPSCKNITVWENDFASDLESKNQECSLKLTKAGLEGSDKCDMLSTESDSENNSNDSIVLESRRNTIIKAVLSSQATLSDSKSDKEFDDMMKLDIGLNKEALRKPSISIEMTDQPEVEEKEKEETSEYGQLSIGLSIESNEGADASERTASSSDGSRSGSRRETMQISDSGSVLSLRPGLSVESSDAGELSEKGGSDGSRDSRRDTISLSDVTSCSQNSLLRPGTSMESSDPGDVSEKTGSDLSRQNTSSAGKTPSTASFTSDRASDCSKDARFADRRMARCDGRSSSEETPLPKSCTNKLVRQGASAQEPSENLSKTQSSETSLSGSTSHDSLISDSGGGAITFHRYYHVFKEGELDQLIEKYVENLHIISSYYDHANWCIIAEKVQVWTI